MCSNLFFVRGLCYLFSVLLVRLALLTTPHGASAFPALPPLGGNNEKINEELKSHLLNKYYCTSLYNSNPNLNPTAQLIECDELQVEHEVHVRRNQPGEASAAVGLGRGDADLCSLANGQGGDSLVESGNNLL